MPGKRAVIILIISFCGMALCLRADQAPGRRAAPGQAARLGHSTIADGFTFAAVGDLIVAQPESANPNPGFQAALKVLRGASVAFGNFEGTALDVARFAGHPQAENGGTAIVDSPAVPADVKKMGFGMVSRANNHSTDWGVEGMEQTDRLLDKAGVVHAGTGRTLAAARGAGYLETRWGRVALVSMAASFTPMSRAGNPLGEVPGRPGVDALRTTRSVLVTADLMRDLVKLRKRLPPAPERPLSGTPSELDLAGTHFRLSDHVGYSFAMDRQDLAGILRSIREAKETADFVVATIHSHLPGNWSDDPPDFLPKLAHLAIDNGADVFVGHGPHRLRGIEIYKGKPIFYSLGNFFFEGPQQQPLTRGLYREFHADPATTVPAELMNQMEGKQFSGEVWFHSVIAVTRFDHGQLTSVTLYPIDLGDGGKRAGQGVPRGIPHLASPEVAGAILRRLQKLSRPFGTDLEIRGSVGVIRPSPRAR